MNAGLESIRIVTSDERAVNSLRHQLKLIHQGVARDFARELIVLSDIAPGEALLLFCLLSDIVGVTLQYLQCDGELTIVVLRSSVEGANNAI